MDLVVQTRELLRPSQWLLGHRQLHRLPQSEHERYQREIQEQSLEHYIQLEHELHCDRELHCNVRLQIKRMEQSNRRRCPSHVRQGASLRVRGTL